MLNNVGVVNERVFDIKIIETAATNELSFMTDATRLMHQSAAVSHSLPGALTTFANAVRVECMFGFLTTASPRLKKRSNEIKIKS